MEKEFDLINAIHKAIEYELIDFSEKLQNELFRKYEKEFDERMRDHRRKVVLDVCETLEIHSCYDTKSMRPQISIKLT